MVIELIERILWVLFVVSTLNILRHGYFLVQSWVKSTEENPTKYFLSFRSLLLLSISIGYFITTLIKGISL